MQADWYLLDYYLIGGFFMQFGSMAYAQGGAPAGSGGGISMIIMMVVIFVIFYLIIFLPQRKKDKEHKKMINELQKGDKVLTASGMYGVVTGVRPEEGIVTVKIADKTQVDFAKSAIQGKIK